VISENWTRENIAWAGGFFEGEGTITARAPCPFVAVGSTDLDVLRRFHNIMGVGGISGPRKPAKPHYKPLYFWSCGGNRRVIAVLAALWPFLGERRQQKAKEAIELAAKAVRWAHRTHCKHGHEFTVVNTIALGGKRRACRTCAEAGRYKRWSAQSVIRNK
jgi:hypothetical protein